MTRRQITAALLLGVVALLLAWDIFVAAAATGGGEDATISGLLLSFSLRHPVLPFACGVVCGHCFFPQRSPNA